MADNDFTPPVIPKNDTLTGFFFIKGSRDYPINHKLNERFGFDAYQKPNGEIEVSETPVFGTTLREIYMNHPNIVEISNNYSGEQDTYNGIVPASGTTYDSSKLRYDRSEEYISTLMLHQPDDDTNLQKFFKKISPNYSLGTGEGGITAKLSSALNSASSLGSTSYDQLLDKNELRYHIFWQKLITFLEFIKRYENEIAKNSGIAELNGGVEGISSSSTMPLGIISDKAKYWYTDRDGSSDGNAVLTTLFDENNFNTDTRSSTFKKVLYLYFLTPDTVGTKPTGEGEVNGSANVRLRDGYTWNPLSGSFINNILSTEDPASLRTADNPDSDISENKTIAIAKTIDRLNAKEGFYGISNEKLTPGIDIRPGAINDHGTECISGAQCFFRQSDGKARISHIKFSLNFAAAPVEANNSQYRQQVNFDIYFDPDAFDLNTSGAKRSTELPVWTYNDRNFDNDLRVKFGGEAYRYPTTDSNFNLYDNDYQNVLLPKPADGEFSIRGKFIVSDSTNEAEADQEINLQFIAKMKETMQLGDYSNYTTLRVPRYSPFLTNDGTTVVQEGKTIGWRMLDSLGHDTQGNLSYQIFYIFYRGKKAPTQEEIKESVKHYLLELHKKCNDSTHVDNDSTKPFKTIGHKTDEVSLTNFLAKMYPTLFKEAEISIAPIINTQYIREDDLYNPDNFYAAMTMPALVSTAKLINNSFAISVDNSGNVESPPTEIFHIGGLEESSGGDSVKFPYNFPWVAMATSGLTTSNGRVITGLKGFENFRPELFRASKISPSSPAETLQMILIKLTENMFQSGVTGSGFKVKPRYGVLYNIPITYSQDVTYDSTIVDHNQELNNSDNVIDGGDIVYHNKASFTLNAVQFNVYAQVGKNFGANVSDEIDESGKPVGGNNN